MLVLSRERGEKIMIGESIVVTILDIRDNDVVRIGIDAPIEIPIHREEVFNSIHGIEDTK